MEIRQKIKNKIPKEAKKNVWIYKTLKGKARLEWAKSELRHEMNEGTHTYHACDCTRRACRSNMCVLCWKEEIKRLENLKGRKQT